MINKFRDFNPEIDPSAYISAQAWVSGKVKLGKNVSIWPYAVLRGDVDTITVMDNSNIQDAVLVHTKNGSPAVIGKNVTIGHGAILHGCSIADFCLIGMGAIMLDDSGLGEYSIVGAGAVVPEGSRLGPGGVYLGVPAKRTRDITDRERKLIETRASDYVRLRDEYKRADGQG